MKYKARKYAQALVNALLEKKADENKISENFLKLLQKNGDMKASRDILALAGALLLQKTGNKKIILETARKIDTGEAVKSFVKKGDLIQEKINPALIAGIKIIVENNQQLDFSLLNKLNNLF